MDTRGKSGLWAIMCLIVLSSCTNNSNKANLLDPAIKYQADTMYSHRYGALSRQLDTICLNLQDSLVRIYTDSLVKQQTDQIDAILGRNKKSIEPIINGIDSISDN